LFGSRDRRPRSRAYPGATPSMRRYETPRPEPRRVEPVRADYGRADRRRSQPEVNWRRRGMIALASTAVLGVLVGAGWLYRSDVFRVKVIDINGVQVANTQAIAAAAAVSDVSMVMLDLEGAR